MAGQTPKSIRAFANLKVLCEEHLKGRYRIEVIDLMENPQLARGDQIIADSDPDQKTSATCPKDYWRPFQTACGYWWAWTCERKTDPDQERHCHGRQAPEAKEPPGRKAETRMGRESGAGRSHSRQAKYVLRLYVSGSTLKSSRAVENIKRVCEQHLKNRYDLEVIDIYQQAKLARDEQIVAVPTLIKRLPLPLRRLIGDMSNQEKVLFGLDLRGAGVIAGGRRKEVG